MMLRYTGNSVILVSNPYAAPQQLSLEPSAKVFVLFIFIRADCRTAKLVITEGIHEAPVPFYAWYRGCARTNLSVALPLDISARIPKLGRA